MLQFCLVQSFFFGNILCLNQLTHTTLFLDNLGYCERSVIVYFLRLVPTFAVDGHSAYLGKARDIVLGRGDGDIRLLPSDRDTAVRHGRAGTVNITPTADRNTTVNAQCL